MSFDIRSNLSDLNVKYVQLRPVNQNSDNTYAYKQGLPLIRFEINDSMAPLLLNGAQLRVSGKFTASKTGGAALDLNNYYLNRFSGVASAIDNITISSRRLNSVIERVQNYNRLLPSIVSGLHGKNDMMGDLFHQGGSIFNNFIGRNALIARDNDKGMDFSIPLYLGMLHSGQDINVSRTSGLSGLTIDILLKSDANVVWGSDANTNNGTYNLSDLVLTVPLLDVSGSTAQVIEKAPPTMNFNTWSSIFTTINSSAAVVSLNPGLSRVTSVLYNALNSAELGDQNFDPGRLGNMGQLDNLRYTKNGILFPLQYRIDTTDRENASNAQGGATDETCKVRAVSVRNTIEGLLTTSFFNARHNFLAFGEFDANVVNVSQTAGNNQEGVNVDESYGILYDKFGSGSDFNTSTWAVELKAPDVDGTAATSQSLFVYYLNKNTIEYSPQGVNIIR